MRKSKSLTGVVASVLVCSSLACDDDVASPPPFEELGRCTNFDALKQPFFGDTHVHTALSLDANLQATRLGPSEAYAFAKGQSVGIQPFDGSGKPMRHIQLDRPLDFVMLSDHAEFFGTISVCTDPQFAAYGSEGCKEFRDEPSTAFIAINSKTAYDIGYPDLCGTSGFECKKAGEEVWKHVQRAADAAYDKSSACTFTSFVGFEWSSNPRTMNLHRNVLFRNHVVPSRAANALDEKSVEDLWSSLESDCLDKNTGCDVITIPHNSNLSNGLMFLEEKADGAAFDLDYLRKRRKMEPLFEVFQHKGDSECGLEQTASDEYCGFEKLPWSNLASANLGGKNLDRFNDVPRGDFLRAAYGQGLALESRLGVNPFQYGIIASTDTHIAAPGQVSEKHFPGHGGAGQPNGEPSSAGNGIIDGLTDVAFFNPGGLAGVWAEENSREGIFQAMRRRETFGTSGPRISMRFFGGWDLPQDLCARPDRIAVAYQKGVPMGGNLPALPKPGLKPRFFVAAQQDPGTKNREPVPLKEIQIIKGWIETASTGQYRSKIIRVSGDGQSNADVDLKTCTASAKGSGKIELCGTWVDEDFEADQRAYYYVRVIENPTCRWTTEQCVQAQFDCTKPNRKIDEQCCDPVLGLNRAHCEAIDCTMRDALSDIDKRCCDPVIRPIIHERGWTSPIWFSP